MSQETKIIARLDALIIGQQGLPAQIRDIVRDEQQKCPAFLGYESLLKQSSENTGIIRTVVRKTRSSIAPAARAAGKLPRWAQFAIGLIGALVGSGGVAAAIASIVN